MGGKTTVQAPVASAEEKALQREQAESLRLQKEATQSQQELTKMLMPALLQSAGFRPTYSAATAGVDVSAQKSELAKLSQQRAVLAQQVEKLKGPKGQFRGNEGAKQALDNQISALDAQSKTLQQQIDSAGGDVGGKLTGYERDPAIIAQEESQRAFQLDSLETAKKSLELQNAQLEQQLKLMPTDEDLLREKQIKDSQLALLQKQLDDANAPPSEQDLLRQGIETQLLQREQAALNGELPIDPGLLSDLSRQEKDLKDRLQQQFGPGYETSTPGIETMGDFFKNKEQILEAARRGDLSLSQQLAMGMQGSIAGGNTTNLNDVNLASRPGVNPLAVAGMGMNTAQFGMVNPAQQLASAQGISSMFNPSIAGFGSNAGGYGGAQQGFQFDRGLQFQANQFNAQQQDPFGQIFGSILGIGIGAATGGMGTAAGTSIGTRLFG